MIYLNSNQLIENIWYLSTVKHGKMKKYLKWIGKITYATGCTTTNKHVITECRDNVIETDKFPFVCGLLSAAYHVNVYVCVQQEILLDSRVRV